MVGFFFFIMTVVLGVLALVWGLRGLGIIGSDPAIPPAGTGVSRADLERIHDVLGALESRLDGLQEQQQFLERLLAERDRPAALPPGAAPDAHPEPEVDSVLFDTEE